MDLDLFETLEKLPRPIAICDGGSIGSMEEGIIYILELEKIPFSLEVNLYDRDDFDLSKYKTVIFSTMDGSPYVDSKTGKIFNSFDKKNLQTVIVLNKNAFKKVKDLSKKLKIECLGFSHHLGGFFDPEKMEGYW